jgi:hypothetical protein
MVWFRRWMRCCYAGSEQTERELVLRNRALLLVPGLISATVYMAVTLRLPWWSYGGTLQSWARILGDGREGFGLSLAGLGVLVVAYLWGWQIVRSGRGKRWIIWGFAGLFAATLFWLMPITSDLFTYLSQAHMFTDLGGNPLVDAPLDFNDPLVLAYPTFYASHPTAYGPAWLLMSAPGTLGPWDVVAGLLYLKGLSVTAFFGCAWLLERILQMLRPASVMEGLYLFTWNPLVLVMAAGDGHNDIVMMVLVLLSVWFVLRERWLLAFGALTLSIWIKYVSLILFPLLVLHVWQRSAGKQGSERWVPLVGGGLVVAFVTVCVFVPFWDPENALRMVERFLWPVNWHQGGTHLSSWAMGAGLLLFAVVWGILIRRLMPGDGSAQPLMNAGFTASLLAFVLGAARSQTWHLIWPLALAGLSDRRWAWPMAVALTALMLAVQVWVEWGAPGAAIASSG